MIRGINAWEEEKRRHLAFAAELFKLDTNLEVLNYCACRSFLQPRFDTVRALLLEYYTAPSEEKRAVIAGKLRSYPIADELLVVDPCKLEDGHIIGLTFLNSAIALNTAQMLQAVGPDCINVGVDVTYGLSNLLWALINMGHTLWR
jgi:hypothetical protein